MQKVERKENLGTLDHCAIEKKVYRKNQSNATLKTTIFVSLHNSHIHEKMSQIYKFKFKELDELNMFNS